MGEQKPARAWRSDRDRSVLITSNYNRYRRAQPASSDESGALTTRLSLTYLHGTLLPYFQEGDSWTLEASPRMVVSGVWSGPVSRSRPARRIGWQGAGGDWCDARASDRAPRLQDQAGLEPRAGHRLPKACRRGTLCRHLGAAA